MPLTSDVRSLDGRTVFQHRQQRKNGAFRKIGVLEQAARIADHGAQFEVDRLEMRVDALAAGKLQRSEQLVALRRNYSIFRHSVHNVTFG
jgi:hypothetical protein